MWYVYYPGALSILKVCFYSLPAKCKFTSLLLSDGNGDRNPIAELAIYLNYQRELLLGNKSLVPFRERLIVYAIRVTAPCPKLLCKMGSGGRKEQ